MIYIHVWKDKKEDKSYTFEQDYSSTDIEGAIKDYYEYCDLWEYSHTLALDPSDNTFCVVYIDEILAEREWEKDIEQADFDAYKKEVNSYYFASR